MAKTESPTQLPLSITVSPWAGIVYRIKKDLREFKYSALVLVMTHVLFWLNIGLIAGTGWILFVNKEIVTKGIGIVFIPGDKSFVPAFTEYAVQNLEVLPYLWYGMVGIFFISVIVSVLVYSFGRYGITTFLLLLTGVILALLAKVIVTPILLLGGQ
ncbi:hypothetical protein IT418_01125 [bacterium]|nr:hypothetical protein [bacterium]